MAEQSISAHADTSTVAKLRQAAAREGRTASQITASFAEAVSRPADGRARGIARH